MFFVAFVLSVNCTENWHKCINVSRTDVVGCCVQQFCWKRELESKKKEKRVEGPVAKERKRRIHCQEPLGGASQVT